MTVASDPNVFDDHEFEDMVKEYRVSLLKHIHNHIFNHEDVRDVYQETLLAAYRKWNSYIEQGRRQSWLFGISNNCILMWQRKNLPVQQREVSVEEGEEILKQLTTVDEYQGLEEIFTCSVTPNERAALIRFYQKQHTIPEIAQELGISQDAVKKRLERGRDHLREDLRRKQKNV